MTLDDMLAIQCFLSRRSWWRGRHWWATYWRYLIRWLVWAEKGSPMQYLLWLRHDLYSHPRHCRVAQIVRRRIQERLS